MRFTCTKENLHQALAVVSGVSHKQTNLPILSNIYIEAKESNVELVSTDLEISVRVRVRAKIEESGTFTVPAKTFADYVSLMTDPQVSISLEGNELKVENGQSSTKIKGMPAEDYPVIPEIIEEHGYVFDRETLKEGLSRVAIATAKTDMRPELSGVYMGFFTERFAGLVLAATDSYRLSEKKVAVENGEDQLITILPGKTAQEVVRLLALAKGEENDKTVQLFVSSTQFGLRVDGVELTSRLVEGRYPDYAQIIPTEFKTVATAPTDVLVKKIKAASLFSTTGVNGVTIDISAAEKQIRISSLSNQTGEHNSSLDADVAGEDNAILLNFRYTLDGLQQMTDGDVEFCINSGDAPCIFRPVGKDDFLYIVMPIRK